MDSLRKKEELVLIFDVGSGSVGGALVKMPEGEPERSFDFFALQFEEGRKQKPEILFTTRVPIVFGKTLDFEAFLFEMGKALETVASRALSERLGVPKKIHCFLAAPWCAAQTRTIKLERSLPFVTTEKLLDDLASREIRAFEEENAKRYSGAGESMRLLESELMQVKLNGYKTANPFGKKSKSLEASLFVSIGSERILEALEYHIGKSFSLPVNFHSFAFAGFAVSRDLFSEVRDFLFVDLAGELTEVALVKDEALAESVSFPYGKNRFIRALSLGLNKDLEEASSIFELYLNKKAESRLSSRVSDILKSSKKDWKESFGRALFDIAGSKSIPSPVYITADEDIGEFSKTLIEEEELNQYTVTDGKFNVTILKSGTLGLLARLKGEAESDPFLIIESIFINRI